MGLARRIAWIAAAAVLAAAVPALSGCGSSGSGGATERTPTEEATSPIGQAPEGAVGRECTSTLRVTGVDCETAEGVVEEWEGEESCHAHEGQSISACSLGEYRCLTVEKSERRGVFCAQHGRSIAFVPKS